MPRHIAVLGWLLLSAHMLRASPPDSSVAATTAEPGVTIDMGADLVNRFLWRGVMFGNTWTIQPNMTVAYKGYSLYLWNSSAVKNGSDSFPMDYFAASITKNVHTPIGSFQLSLNDWISAPKPDTAYLFNFKDGWKGGHYIELTAIYTYSENFPLSFTVSHIAHNDPDRPWYIELSYPVHTLQDVTMTFVAGGVFGPSGWYQTTKKGFNLINLAASASKTVIASPSISIPVTVAFIVNSVKEIPYLVATVGIQL